MGLLWRLSIAIMVFVLSLVYALPSVPYLGTALERVLPSSKINLGLDLKGGIHLTLGVDVAKAVSNSLALTGQDLRRVAEDEKIVVLRPAWWVVPLLNLCCRAQKMNPSFVICWPASFRS